MPAHRATASADRHGHTVGGGNDQHHDAAHHHEDADQADSPALLLDRVPDCLPHLLAYAHVSHLPSVRAEFSLRDEGEVMFQAVTLCTSVFHIETRCDGGCLPKIDIPDSVVPGPLREYLEWLGGLHEKAGYPGARKLANKIGCSHSTVTRLFKSYPSNLELAFELVKYLAKTALRPIVRADEDLDAVLDKLDELLRAAAPTVNRAKLNSKPRDSSATVTRQSRNHVTWDEVERRWAPLNVAQTLVLHFCGTIPNHPHASKFDADDRLIALGDRVGPTSYVRLCADQAFLSGNLQVLQNERPDTVIVYFEGRTDISTDLGRNKFDVVPLQEVSIMGLLMNMHRPPQALLIFEAADCENAPLEVATRMMLREIVELNRGVAGRHSASASAVFIDADENGPGIPLPVLLEEGARAQEESGITHLGLSAVIAAAQNLTEVHFHTEEL